MPYKPICFKEDQCSSAKNAGGVVWCCDCKIKDDNNLLDIAFKKLVKELYNMRSQLVHNAKYVHITIPEESNISGIFDAYKRKGEYFWLSTEVNYAEFKKMVIRSSIRYLLDKHKKENHAGTNS